MQVTGALVACLLVLNIFVQQICCESLNSYLSKVSDFSILVSAMNASGWEPPASNTTVFVPTNTAFNRMIKDLGVSQEDVLADTTNLLEILDNHVVSEKVTSKDLVDGEGFTSEAGKSLLVKIENNTTQISTVGSTAYISEADIPVTGSIVHIIDEVLLPFKKPELKPILEVLGERSELTNLVEAISVAGIEFEPNVYTIFAPSNTAFENAVALLGTDVASLLNDDYLINVILTAHIIPDARFKSAELFDGQQFFSLEGSPINVSMTADGLSLKAIGSDAAISAADVYAQDAVIHIIDSVLFPYVLEDEPINVAVESEQGIMTAEEAATTITPSSVMNEITAQFTEGCTCDQDTMKAMIQEVMSEVLDKYFQ